MIHDGLTNRVYVSDLLRELYPEEHRRLTRILKEAGVPVGLVHGTRDIWCRDYLPVQVARGRFVQFRYSPDYLRKRARKYITGPDVAQAIPEVKSCVRSEIIVDGGNIIRRGSTAIMTSKVFTENPSIPPRRLKKDLARLLEVDRLILIPREPGDPLGHSDGMVRFIDERTVLLNDYSEVLPAYGKRLHILFRRAGLECVPLPYKPRKAVGKGIPYALGCYINFLHTRQMIVAPTFGLPADGLAVRVLNRVFPRTPVVSLDCRDLCRAGGCIHCATWSIVI